MGENRVAPRRRRWAVVGLLGVVLALAAAAVYFGLAEWSTEAEESAELAVLAAARQEVVNLITTGPNRAPELYDRIVKGATGTFAQQLAGQSGAFVRAVREAAVTSEGSVAEAGIVAVDERRATVLLAVNSHVRNTQVPGGLPRHYRMLVTLDKQGDAWLMSNLEFVP